MEEAKNLEAANAPISEINTRLRDMDERNRLIRERVLLLGKNLLESREEIGAQVKEIKEENKEIKKELEKIKKIISSLTSEYAKLAKKDEMYLIERMLKDFQPLEFARKKDVEDIINQKIAMLQSQNQRQ